MKTIDLTPSIVKALNANKHIRSITQGRIASPKVELENGKEAPNPKIGFRQMGGPVGFHRYLFVIDADTHKEARELAIRTRDYLTEEIVDFEVCEVLYIAGEGTITDTTNEITGKPQAMFYVLFEVPYE